MHLIIGVGHQKNVGKDTFVGYCIDVLRAERRRLNIMRRGFADKLYEFCYSVYKWAGFQPKLYYEQDPSRKNDFLPALNCTARELLIKISQHIKKFDEEIWLNANLKNSDYDVLFCTDLRFPVEFNKVEELKGILVRVTKPGLPIPTDEADTALNGWEEKWHIHISNDKGKQELYALAESFIKQKVLPRI